MKAMVMETCGIAHVRAKDLPEPRPGPGDILVRLRAASLNFRDLVILDGGYGSRQKTRDLIPLSDGAGEIVEIGPGVTRWQPGDRVVASFFPDWLSGPPEDAIVGRDPGGMADGVACEYRVFGEDAVLAIPPSLDFVEAASLPCAAVTAWNAVRTHGATGPEHSVLIQGTGGVALFALQFARAAGARILSISSNAEKLERQRQLGAAHAINYRDDPDWGKTVRRLTEGRGVDLVVETGGAGTFKQSLRALRRGGMIGVIGMVSGSVYELSLPHLMLNHVRLQGISVGSRAEFAAMLAAMAQHRIKPVIDKVFPLDALPEAFEYLKSGRHVGKVCLEIG